MKRKRSSGKKKEPKKTKRRRIEAKPIEAFFTNENKPNSVPKRKKSLKIKLTRKNEFVRIQNNAPVPDIFLSKAEREKKKEEVKEAKEQKLNAVVNTLSKSDTQHLFFTKKKGRSVSPNRFNTVDFKTMYFPCGLNHVGLDEYQYRKEDVILNVDMDSDEDDVIEHCSSVRLLNKELSMPEKMEYIRDNRCLIVTDFDVFRNTQRGINLINSLNSYVEAKGKSKKYSRVEIRELIYEFVNACSTSQLLNNNIKPHDFDFFLKRNRQKVQDMWTWLRDWQSGTRNVSGILLSGLYSTGKRSCVEFIAENLKVPIIRISPSMKRSKSDILNMLRGGGKSGHHSINFENESTVPLLYFEEIDNVFESDASFFAALTTLINNEKYPIVMTCNKVPKDAKKYLTNKRIKSFELHQNLVFENVMFLKIILNIHGTDATFDILESFVHLNRNDIRKSVVQLDFFLRYNSNSLFYVENILGFKTLTTASLENHNENLLSFIYHFPQDILFNNYILYFNWKFSLFFEDDHQESQKILSKFSRIVESISDKDILNSKGGPLTQEIESLTLDVFTENISDILSLCAQETELGQLTIFPREENQRKKTRSKLTTAFHSIKLPPFHSKRTREHEILPFISTLSRIDKQICTSKNKKKTVFRVDGFTPTLRDTLQWQYN